ncbi:unnamed protein product [Caenorhabditis bovis]|uniref:CHCH domain-containing protein n=1 Tax=Caenorhabditis bovis TaxID=2654633 RepID=A0A8S1EJD4_9PELO|nr:unnamed protein product [Caenorhabditis bovis]
MVRRRTASPQASAPVRSRPAPSPPPQRSSFAASPPPPRPAAAAPTPTPTAAPTMAPPAAAPSQGPGLFGQMAATAGGVAIGSAVGHAVGSMFTGGSSSHSEPAQQVQQAAPVPQSQAYSQPCEFEWKQFIECSQNQSDISLCNGFNEAFKQCKTRYA